MMPKLITCSYCGGSGLEEFFGEMPVAFGTCTNCAGTGKTESRYVESLTYESYIADAKKRGASMKAPGSLIFPKDMPPIAKVADNGVDVVIDEAATRARYWGEDTKTIADCEAKFDIPMNFAGEPDISGHADFSTGFDDEGKVSSPEEDQDTRI
ncbi:hypothetical protein CcrColossus_gp075 [Caulobacter phage CcrColossus]|uniref:Uncharacterized protein n=1 Tax=Caulobacter phage CcrColossus TaxID=1211640 RepID=K4JUD8_9CAUD|nr:hypothetical protein CcrColossus_gp075 [Caulobacter phage CcrColossus]AFU87945.1 hypothetical protein CcrColossus_gp075 [Caulobacter phage CcrColossus]